MNENEAIEIIKKDACNNNNCIPQLCNDGCMYGDTKCAFSMAIKALEEVQQYRHIGTVEFLTKAKKLANLAKKCGTIGKAIDECAEYEEIGTVEEFRAAMEKQTAKKVSLRHVCKLDGFDAGDCPACGEAVSRECDGDDIFCPSCGQRLDWSDTE